MGLSHRHCKAQGRDNIRTPVSRLVVMLPVSLVELVGARCTVVVVVVVGRGAGVTRLGQGTGGIKLMNWTGVG